MSTTHASLASTLRGLLDRLAALDAKHRLRAELGRLDARTLRDVGVTRAEIDAEIRRLRCLAFGPRVPPPGGMPACGQCQVKPKSRPPDIVR